MAELCVRTREKTENQKSEVRESVCVCERITCDDS